MRSSMRSLDLPVHCHKWSFFEAVALVLVSLTQIFYVKKLFETTRTI